MNAYGASRARESCRGSPSAASSSGGSGRAHRGASIGSGKQVLCSVSVDQARAAWHFGIANLRFETLDIIIQAGLQEVMPSIYCSRTTKSDCAEAQGTRYCAVRLSMNCIR